MISTIFTLVTEGSEEAILVSVKELEQVTYIRYLIDFLDDVSQDGSALHLVSTLLDLGSEVNAMHPIFAEKLGFVVQTTNIGAHKIDGTILKTYKIVVAAISLTNQADKVRFFEKSFLVANIGLNEILGILFLTLSGADVDFLKRELWWRSYTIEKALSTIKQVELVGKKEFAAAVFDLGHETFVIYVAFLESPSQEGDVHLFCRAQIAALVANEAPTSILTKYSDFADVFSPELASELPEYTRINDHAIKLVDN